MVRGELRLIRSSAEWDSSFFPTCLGRGGGAWLGGMPTIGAKRYEEERLAVCAPVNARRFGLLVWVASMSIDVVLELCSAVEE